MSKRREIERFEMDRARVITFAARSPFLFRKAWGEFACCALQGGKVAFFPIEVYRRIEALGLAAGEPLEVTRRRGLFGSEWELKKGAATTTAPSGGSANTHPEPIRTPAAIATPQSERLLVNLYAVLSAVATAEQYAITRGRPIQFSPEDIRALAISGFIEQGRFRT